MIRSVLILSFALMWSPCTGVADLESVVAATCKISNPTSTATGILLTTNDGAVFILSAAHVFEKTKGEHAKIIVHDHSTRTEHTVHLRTDGKPRWRRHATADVAILPVSLTGLRTINFDSLGDVHTIRLGEDAWVAGFPAQLEADASGAPVVRRGAVASTPLAPTAEHPTFLLSCATAGGDSGAPVVTKSGGLIGLVVGLHRETTTTTSPTEERTVHRPLDIAIAVHAGILRDLFASTD